MHPYWLAAKIEEGEQQCKGISTTVTKKKNRWTDSEALKLSKIVQIQ